MAILIWAGLFGCAPKAADPPIRVGEPLGLQMLRTEAELRKYPFRTLLEFEAPTDPVFVKSDGSSAKLSQQRRHTGASSLMLDSGTKGITIRLPSLFSGSVFPGRWTLAGAYFYATQPQRMTASYDVDGQVLASITVQVPPGQWTPVLLDVATATDQAKPSQIGVLRFTFPAGLSQPLWCDDVVVLDNKETFIDSPSWSIRQRGFQCIVEKPGDFKTILKTPEASEQGWTPGDEVNDIRALFVSKGKEKSRLIYSAGREIVDGKCRPLAGDTGIVQQHSTPARIEIAPEMGRVERNAPGDANNDGFCEATGTYQLIASAQRIEFTITPPAAGLTCPVLEIAGLPEGKLLVTMEGRLVEKMVRIKNGHMLVELPGTLQRPTTVNIKVSQ